MKKLIMLSLLVMSTLAASAEIKFQGIDNNGATNVMLTDTDAPDDAKITDAVLYCNGKEYRAKNIRCNVVAVWRCIGCSSSGSRFSAVARLR